jgi:hypothetical protein
VAAVRDLAIIVLAVWSLIIGCVLIVLLWEILNLVKLLRAEIKPILDSADETVRTLRGTTVFMSDTFVNPVVRASGVVAGVARVLRIVTKRR